MTKLMISLLAVVVIALSACNSGKTYKVTVVEKVGWDYLIGGDKAIVETANGSRVECFIDESLLLNNKLPFEATMSKSEDGRYGYIKDTSSSNDIFDVTVVANVGVDRIVGGNKVVVTTKSGDSLMCYVGEEFLLTKDMPFPAKMVKNQYSRYGSIKE